MQDRARAPQPPTNPEIKSFVTHIMENPPRNLVCIGLWSPWGKMGKKCQLLAQNDQKCIFWTKFGRFRPKILIFTGVSKSFGTNITGKRPGQFVRVFWSAWKQMGQKYPYLAENACFGPNLFFFGQKSNFF